MPIKFIEQDGKKFYGNFGGRLVEATKENIEAGLHCQKSVFKSIERLYEEHKSELMRLQRIRLFIIRNPKEVQDE